MTGLWLMGLVAHRAPRLAATSAGASIAIALVGIVILQGIADREAMTRRAVATLPVDWRILLAPGASAAEVERQVRQGGRVEAIGEVRYASVGGLSAASGATSRRTGAGIVLGLPPGYGAAFPGQIRLLAGSADGVLVAQQTAANLGVGPGDAVSVLGAAGTGEVVVDGVVDLPNAAATFGPIGGSGGPPTPPPDDVLLVPAPRFDELFPAGTAGTTRQIHVRLDHSSLPSDPGLAYADARRRASHVEVLAAGAATIGNDLATRLDAVRGDAIYAALLSLFLGVPGAVLAMSFTVAAASAGGDRRRREQGLLRMRGASDGQVLRIAATEAALVAVSSGLVGTALAVLVAAALGTGVGAWTDLAALAGAALCGMGASSVAVLAPAWLDLRSSSTAACRLDLAARPKALWRRLWVDAILIVAAAGIVWRSASTGYQVVLAPEGVATSSIDYTAFMAPLAFWIGGALAAVRLFDVLLASPRLSPVRALASLLGPLAEAALSSSMRERGRIAGVAAVTALTLSFGVSVAGFGATYERQSLVDARLTNGADVTVTGTPGAPAGERLAAIRAAVGVAAAEPMQHRHAYVGHDLQDLYGIDPVGIVRATTIADADVADRDARGSLRRLASAVDGVLVSQETVNDYRLATGDLLNLRLRIGDGTFRVVPFHVAGVVNEFPTAPRDSFLVANMAYLSEVTGRAPAEVVLVRAATAPAAVAAAVRDALGPSPSLTVTDLDQASRVIGSSLTAMDLRAITGVEVGFAIVLTAAASGLVLALGLFERRRTQTILWALGASPGLAARMLWVEGLAVLGMGVPVGLLLGSGVSAMLVVLLGGIFDPPPDAMVMPWSVAAVLAATAPLAAAGAVAWASSRPRARSDLDGGIQG
jgi:putative ABC transport system permease protein